ncbi:MAG TPA: helix-turn-helix domain-containing protein [Clostridia bacterium]|nr:helix-turn-helix domain-containing protein [Clostridia bacterium]
MYKWDTLFGKEETQRVQAAEMLYYVLNELARMSGDFIAHKSRLKAQADMLRREKRAREEMECFFANRTTFMSFKARQEETLRSVRAGRKEAAAKAVVDLFAGAKALNLGNERIFRAYAMELIVNMMRAAVEGGASVENALSACDEYMKILAMSTMSPAEIGQWISAVAKNFARMAKQGRTQEPMGVVTRVAEYVSSSRGQRVTVSKVADAVYMSPSGLSKLFKREIGCTVSEFINKVQIDKAKKLLGDPRYSVSDVAFELGFNDPSNFCKLFKRLEGLTPGDFRRREAGRGDKQIPAL